MIRGDDLRFAFGANWANFLRHLDEDRIAAAEASLRERLGTASLAGRSFLDIGSGSGLSSLAARRLGARVHSFDYDANSVACTRELRRRHYPDDSAWTVESGSALDADYLASLGLFDIVYSFGVLHHTGRMWGGIELATRSVAPGGTLFIALYNDQGWKSRFWWWVKRIYVTLPRWLAIAWTILVALPFEVRQLGKALVAGDGRRYLESWTNYKANRGMSRWHDLLDWMGGFPFEVARPADVAEFLVARGFEERFILQHTDAGCVHYVFAKAAVEQAANASGYRLA